MSGTPLLARTRGELEGLLAPARAAGRQVGLVPTMGALHEGHASLMRVARERTTQGPVVVSVFVNPLQFGAGEDLDRYPRTLEADLVLAEREGVDVVFAPSVHEVYPGGDPQVTVEPGPVGEILEGRTRPGHFRGVLTVVAKLFGLVRPDVAVFGEKDYQQLALIRRMVSDLCLAVGVEAAPTCREPDGLALSSRNRYLEPGDRARASILHRALVAAQESAPYGTGAARRAAMRVLDEDHDLRLDYLDIRAADLAEVAENAAGIEGRALVAARFGTTRLIDNLPLTIGRPEGDI